MSAFHDNALIGASGQQGYKISRSVRLRSSASAYLNRTFTTPTSNQKMTLSCWVKIGSTSQTAGQLTFLNGGDGTQANATNSVIQLRTDGTGLKLQILCNGGGAATVGGYRTFAPYLRDYSAWYHIVLAADTTQASAANRYRGYINGVEITSYTGTDPNQNVNITWLNTAVGHLIGRNNEGGGPVYGDTYITEMYWIDGQQLTPSSFGETNAITGVWQPKKYAGTYGTNGFYLNFSDNSAATAAAIGKDYSGNGNNWTPNNISVTAGVTYDSMLDVPTVGATSSNYATFNPIAKASSQPTFSNGNLNLAASSAWNGAVGTIGVTSGKWYWEVVNGNADSFVGICGDNLILTTADPQTLTGTIVYYGGSGSKRVDGTDTAYGASYSTETIGVALDIDGGTITFYKNNTSQGSISLSLSTLNGKTIFPFFVKYASTAIVNFGQRPFTYTPPTGFVALNTQNLPAPTISNGANYMAATTYTGTGSALTIANTVGSASFQPDLVWVKGRSGATDHAWYDAVRGVQKQLESNTTTAETTETTGLTAFGSTGFTIGALAQMNTNAATYVGWQWNAGGSTVTNTSGSISAQVRANATAGFSVVTGTFPSTGTSCTFGHGLGVAPSMIISKGRDGGTSNWIVRHTSLGNMTTKYLEMNNTGAVGTGPNAATAPSSTIASVSTDGLNNNMAFVAYCFASVAGYSAFGSYTGNGSADGPFVYLGFEPRWVMIKQTNTTGDWQMYDTSRAPINVASNTLYANGAFAEDSNTTNRALDLLSNGFKLRSSASFLNASGGTYVYACFAESPFKLSLAR